MIGNWRKRFWSAVMGALLGPVACRSHSRARFWRCVRAAHRQESTVCLECRDGEHGNCTGATEFEVPDADGLWCARACSCAHPSHDVRPRFT